MQDLISGILYSFAALFIILDPLLSVPIFAAMTKGRTTAEVHKQALIAVAVAGGLMYVFLLRISINCINCGFTHLFTTKF